jgi:hypothetical protein
MEKAFEVFKDSVVESLNLKNTEIRGLKESIAALQCADRDCTDAHQCWVGEFCALQETVARWEHGDGSKAMQALVDKVSDLHRRTTRLEFPDGESERLTPHEKAMTELHLRLSALETEPRLTTLQPLLDRVEKLENLGREGAFGRGMLNNEFRERIERLEAGKKGEAAGYHEQNQRIGELEKHEREHAKWHEVTGFGLRITALENAKAPPDEVRLRALETRAGNHGNALNEHISKITELQKRQGELERRQDNQGDNLNAHLRQLTEQYAERLALLELWRQRVILTGA